MNSSHLLLREQIEVEVVLKRSTILYGTLFTDSIYFLRLKITCHPNEIRSEFSDGFSEEMGFFY